MIKIWNKNLPLSTKNWMVHKENMIVRLFQIHRSNDSSTGLEDLMAMQWRFKYSLLCIYQMADSRQIDMALLLVYMY